MSPAPILKCSADKSHFNVCLHNIKNRCGVNKILILFFTIFILVHADGLVVQTDSLYQIYSRNQMALIRYSDSTEELVLLVKTDYSYNNDIAWIVPLPNLPQLSMTDLSLFEDLAEISKPVYQNKPSYDFGCGNEPSPGVSRDYYEIVQYANIYGFLSTTVINTNNTDSLRHWLSNNGYVVKNDVLAVLQEYINKNWTYFFCARITPNTTYDKNALAIKLIFNTSEPVFPMKLSKMNYSSYNSRYDLFLYVISPHKMTFTKSILLYANKISSNELQEIQTDFPELALYLDDGDFLTKLLKEHQSFDDFTDITLVQAKDDKEYRELYGTYYYYYGIAIPFFPISILYFVLLKVYYYIKTKKTRKKALISY